MAAWRAGRAADSKGDPLSTRETLRPLLPLGSGQRQYKDPSDDARRWKGARDRQASIAGLVGLGLPVILACFGSPVLDTVSGYYYEPWLGTFFTTSIGVVAITLIAWRGTDHVDDFWGTLAGICAFGVALFPTDHMGLDDTSRSARPLLERMKPGACSHAPLDADRLLRCDSQGWVEWLGVVHLGFAGATFILLAILCLFVFTRARPHELDGDRLRPWKKLRNTIYIIAGVCMLLPLVAIGIIHSFGSAWRDEWDARNLTFVAEAIMLWFFALAWIVKGRLFGFLPIEDSVPPESA